MPQHEIRIPFPVDMLGDLDTALVHVEDTHLSQLDTVEKQGPVQALIAAVKAMRAAIHAHRSGPADEASHLPLERAHLLALSDAVRDASTGESDRHHAATRVADWLDREL